MAEAGDGSPNRLHDNEVGETLARLDELLGEVEQTPGPAGEIAVEAVSSLARVYGEALARALSYVSDNPTLREAFLRDELLGHLLVLHDIHPEPARDRISRVIAGLTPAVRERGGEVEFAGVDAGVATVRLTTHGCGSSSSGIADAVRDAVLAVAPELSRVDVVSGAAAQEPAFIPLEGLMAHAVTNGAHP